MIAHVLTLFPEIFRSFLSQSLLAKALAKGLLEVSLVNIRDFAKGPHLAADDRPYGGGPGMVLMLCSRLIACSPKRRTFLPRSKQ